MAEGEQKTGLESILFNLMEKGSGANIDQVLILMSLVNLMGIVNLLDQNKKK